MFHSRNFDRKWTTSSPILSNVLLELSESGLALTTTDLEILVQTSCDVVSFEGGGRFTVPARKLFDLSRALPSDSQITIEVSDNRAVVKSGRSRYSLQVLPASGYPTIEGGKDIKSISIKFEDGKKEKIKTDLILSFFGLIMKLGPIAEWGLNMDKKTITVNSQNFETNKKGIFAVGDICSYPGKLKLILSGFHEVALASVECFKRARPNEKYRFEFTTSSKIIQDRLGKK